jgi:cobalt/nickel transport system permease protein
MGAECTHCSPGPVHRTVAWLQSRRIWRGGDPGGDVHIPDGYLSPQTCAVMYGAAVPFWLAGARRLRKVVKTRFVPLLALGAAYCFLVMMFNIPVPDGTTAHAVGGVLVAVLLGPWAAVIAVSVALGIQALFFGDGGVLAFGANCCNMAVAMTFTGYAVYKVMAGRAPLTAPRRAIAAGVGAYVGINVAALCAAIEFGLQPDLFYKTTASGAHVPLYAPFHLSQTVPAMLLAHLLVAGVAELVLTAGVITYLQRANLPILRINQRTVSERDGERVGAASRVPLRGLLVGLGALLALVPLGLLAAGGAFGEDRPGDLDLKRYGLDAVPSGLARYSDFWSRALLPGYDFRHGAHPNVGYYVSAVVGTVLVAGLMFVAFRLATLAHRRRRTAPARVTAGEVGNERVEV